MIELNAIKISKNELNAKKDGKNQVYLATELSIKSLNLLLYSAGGTHDTSLLKKVLLSRYSMFFMV